MKFAFAPLALALVDASRIESASADAAFAGTTAGWKDKEHQAFPLPADRRLQIQSTCSDSELVCDGSGTDSMGYNWQLSAETEILDEYISVTGLYETELRPRPTPTAVTSQTFQRPLKVSVDVQVDPTSSSECVTMSVFPTDACFGASSPTSNRSRNGCGYAAGVGAWTNKFFSGGEEFGHGMEGGSAIADMTAWHKVTIELVEDGSTKYYLNDVLEREVGDSTSSTHGGSHDEGRIAFYSCASGRYKNLKVECPASNTDTPTPICPDSPIFNLGLGKAASQSTTYQYAVANRATDGNTDGVFQDQPINSVTHTNWERELSPIFNLALGKAASQSTTYTYAVANRATDGNTDGVFQNQAINSVTHTNWEREPWWKVDLLDPNVGPAIYSITSVRVYNRVDCCRGRILPAEVQLLDASENILQTRTLPNQQLDVYYLDFGGFVGQVRYVKVQRTDNGGHTVLHLAEVEVYGSQVPPTANPTPLPTSPPSKSPTPTLRPTPAPIVPTPPPTLFPTKAPTPSPTSLPTKAPTPLPTSPPTKAPSPSPTSSPSKAPTSPPTNQPTPAPSHSPTANPSKAPSPGPTNQPTPAPSHSPTMSPTTSAPTSAPRIVTLSATSNVTMTASADVAVDEMSDEQLSAFGEAFSNATEEMLTSSLDGNGDGVSVDVNVISVGGRLLTLTRRKLENAIDVVLEVTFVTQCEEGCDTQTAETTLTETAEDVTTSAVTDEGLQLIATAAEINLEDSPIDGVSSTLTITGASSTPTEVTTVTTTLMGWALELVSFNSNFTKDSGDELILSYEIGKGRTPRFTVLKKGCKEEIDTANVSSKSSTSPNEDDLTLENLEVSLDVKKDTIVGSNIWDSTNEVVEMCVRVELLSSTTENVIKKLERNFGVKLLFNNEFSTIADAKFGQIFLESEETDAQVDNYILACTCESKESFGCKQNVLGPNDYLNVCIKSIDDEMEINYLDSLKMTQGDLTLDIVQVKDLVDDSISSKSKVPLENGVHVATVIPFSFFSYETATSAQVSGVVFLKLAGSRRRLAVEIGDFASPATTRGRALQQSAGDLELESAFAIEIQLGRNELELDSNGAIYGVMNGFVVVTAALVAAAFVAIW